MTGLLTGPPASAATPATPTKSATSVAPPTRAGRRWRWWQPGWPLTYFLTGYPLWWVLGLTQILVVVAGVIMVAQLVRAGQVRVRYGFGWWLMFLAWVAVGVFLLQVNAPGAQAGASNARYVTFVYRLLLYFAATSVLLYVYNFRGRIPTTRLLRAFGWFFVTVVAGGVLGASAPYLNFPSAIELVLPHHFAHIEFVHTLIHPRVAQVIDPAHPSGRPRTSAPFTYTNDWGLSFACLLPFFVITWLRRDCGWRRIAGPVILLISLYPVVQSANRGLWFALAVSGAIVVVRAMVHGNIRFAFGAVAVAVAGLAAVLSSSLGSTIIFRLTNAGSAGSRGTLGAETLRSVAEKAPIVGFGTTRLVQGSFYSITGGDSANCVGCAPPPFGTQGHFWLVVFSTGYGGLLLYLGFIFITLFRHVRLRSPIATVGVIVVVVHLVTMLIYDTIGVSLFIIFAAIGLLWQEAARRDETRADARPRDARIGAYVAMLRRGRGLVLSCTALGLICGLLVQSARGTQYEAVTSISVPVGRSQPADHGSHLTVDTVGDLVRSATVARAVDSIAGAGTARNRNRLFVTAETSTRVLDIHVVDERPTTAQRASRAAARAVLAVQLQMLQAQSNDEIAVLQQQRVGLAQALATNASVTTNASLSQQRAGTVSALEKIDNQLARLQADPPTVGSVLSTTPASAHNDAWLVAAASGLLLGFTVAVLLLQIVYARGRRLRRARARLDLPVLARLPSTSGRGVAPYAVEQVADRLAGLGPPTVLSADDSAATCAAAQALDASLGRRREARPGTRTPVVLVAGPATRDRHLADAGLAMADGTIPVIGVVLLSESNARGPRRRTATPTLTPIHPRLREAQS